MCSDLAPYFVRYVFRTLFIRKNLDILRGKFTSNSDKFSHIVAYLESCITLIHSEPCHIQNHGIFRTQGISRILSRHILAYSESFLFWHIQAYPDIFNNDSYSDINFLFSCNIWLHTFQRNLKRRMFFDYDDVNFNARLSLLK